MTRWISILALALVCARGLSADARADYLAAMDEQKAGHWAEAAQGYLKVTAQLPAFAAGWKQLASARFYLGDLEGAVASADRYLDLQADPSFGAWADGLRAKLKMPPRPTPVPTPGPPTPTPQPTPEGLLISAPPPDAEAVQVPIAVADQVDPQALAKVQALENKEAERSAAQMADEAAAVLGQREPVHGRVELGLRLLGGVGFGLGSFDYGEDVDNASAPSDRPYKGAPAGGASAAIELLLRFSDRLDIGVGAFPVAWSEQRKSSVTDTVTRSDDSEASAAFMPLMASLTWRQALGPSFHALFSAGGGVIPSARVHVKSQTVQTALSGLAVSSVTADLDYGLAPAWRVMLGGEWSVSPQLGFELGLQLLGASFADAGGKASIEVSDETGAVTASASDLAVPPQPLQVMSLDLLAGLSLRF